MVIVHYLHCIVITIELEIFTKDLILALSVHMY